MTGVGPRVCWELAGAAVAELPGKPHSRQADPQFPSLFVQLSRGTWSYTEALNISCHWKPRKLGVGVMGYDAGSFQGTETVCTGHKVSNGNGYGCWGEHLRCPSRSDLGLPDSVPFSDLSTGLKRDPSLAVLVLGAALMGSGGDLPPNSLQIAEGLPCWSRELLSTLFSRVSCCPLVGLFPRLPAVRRRPSPPPLQRQPWLSDKGGG